MRILLPVILVFMVACQSSQIDKALQSVSNNDLARDIATLSADSMLGRGPFTIGETRSVNYLTSRMVELGLEPAFGESYIQKVPMVSVVSRVPQIINIGGTGKPFGLRSDDDFCAWSPTINPLVNIDKASLIFAGFGIDAPEYN